MIAGCDSSLAEVQHWSTSTSMTAVVVHEQELLSACDVGSVPKDLQAEAEGSSSTMSVSFLHNKNSR